MIKLMVREMNNFGIVQYNLDECAEQVLSYMEHAGMVPRTKIEYKPLPSKTAYTYSYEWEPEND